VTTVPRPRPWISVLLPVGCLVLLVASAADAQWEKIQKRQGDPPQGYVQPDRMPGKNFVMDCHGKTLGWTSANGTFTDQGQQIATIPMPGRLLEKSDCLRR
jgi:hypothetical protein